MRDLKALLQLISKDSNCTILEPHNELVLEKKIPEDLALFFKLTNGVVLFENEPYGITMVGKEEFVSTNKFLYPEDDVI